MAWDSFSGHSGALVVVDCSSGDTTRYRSDLADTPLPPCSTFKILNALIGLECGLLTAPDRMFYRWDGVERSLPGWNRDLSLREAFQESCVPAFQALAGKIGTANMQHWIDRTGYGDRNISAGIEVFWLPAEGRTTILISPAQQADLMRRIVLGETPFSQQSVAVLKELMFSKETSRGRLFGKTGSGVDDHGEFVLGWFVGWVESNGKTMAFACAAQGRNIMSKQAREVVERFLEQEGLL